MTLLKFKAAIVSAMLVSGCAGTSFDFAAARQVTVGMSQAEVERLLGAPYSVVAKGDSQIWIWSHANVFSGGKTVSFVFKNGLVSQVPQIPDSFR